MPEKLAVDGMLPSAKKPKKAPVSRTPTPSGPAAARPVDPSLLVDPEDSPVDPGPKEPRAPVDPVPKSEGQRLLVASTDSHGDVARAVGASKQIVSCWRRGSKVPAPEARAKIEAAYGIPVTAWDRVPSSPGTAVAVAVQLPPDLSKGSTLDEIVRAQQMIEGLFYDPSIAAIVRVKFVDPLAKILALKARVEREREFLEDRIVREHPEFARLTKALFEALRPWPDAVRAVREAITQR